MAYYKKVREVQIGEEIAEDIYRGPSLLVKKGTKMDERIRRRLRQFGIEQIAVNDQKKEHAVDLHRQVKHHFSEVVNEGEKHIKELFYQNVVYLLNETRYGLALNNLNMMEELNKFFHKLMADLFIWDKLASLKNWDLDTYYHSIDVFFLGIIFAKHLGIKDLEIFSKACLLHDLGKLQISRSILLKAEPLNEEEYQMIAQKREHSIELLSSEATTKEAASIMQQHHESLQKKSTCLTEKLSVESKALMILDVYSAMTLNRPFRSRIVSVETLEYMLDHPERFDTHYVLEFSNMLHIYPVGSKVDLSNGRKAIVTQVHHEFPYLPTVREVERKREYQIPIDLSIRINKINMLQEEEKNFHSGETWQDFLRSLLEGIESEALTLYRQLSRGKTEEEANREIILKAFQTIIERKKQDQITQVEVYLAAQIMNRIMDMEFSSIRELVHSDKGKILLTIPVDDHLGVPLRFFQNQFTLYGWECIRFDFPLEIDEILYLIKKNNICYVSFSIHDHNQIESVRETLLLLKMQAPNVVSIVCTDLIGDLMLGEADLCANISEVIDKLEILRPYMTHKQQIYHLL